MASEIKIITREQLAEIVRQNNTSRRRQITVDLLTVLLTAACLFTGGFFLAIWISALIRTAS